MLPIHLSKLMHVREFRKSRICFAAGEIVASVMKVDQFDSATCLREVDCRSDAETRGAL